MLSRAVDVRRVKDSNVKRRVGVRQSPKVVRPFRLGNSVGAEHAEVWCFTPKHSLAIRQVGNLGIASGVKALRPQQ